MALTEKRYEGAAVRAGGAIAAGMLAVWAGACIVNCTAPLPRPACVAYTALFALLGWRRWRLVVDLAILNLPLWMLLPMRLGVPNFSLVEGALMAAAAGGALRVARTGRFRWFTTPATPYMVLFGIAAVLSASVYFIGYFVVIDSVFARAIFGWIGSILHIEPDSPYHPLRATLTLLEGLVFFHIIVARVRDMRDVHHLARLSLGSAVLVSLFGIVQYFTNWNRVDFEPWGLRINATFPDVNSLASFLVANLFILASSLRIRRGLPRRIAWLALPILMASLFMSHSRAAYGALLAALPVYLFLRAERLAFERPVVRLYKKRKFIALVFLLAMLTVGAAVMGLDYLNHSDLGWTRRDGRIAHALKGRLNIWRSGLYAAAEAPWLGRGTGTFYGLALWHWEPVPDPDEWNPFAENAHNYFLQVMTEMGVVGLTLYLVVIGMLFYQGLRAIVMHEGRSRRRMIGLTCGLFAFLLTCLTGHPQLIVEVNLWFWFAAALLFVPVGSESREFQEQARRQRGFRRVLAALLVLATLAGWRDALIERPTVTASYGMYPREYLQPGTAQFYYHWLRRHAAFRIYASRPDLTFCLCNPFGAAKPNDVTIRIDGREVERRRLDTAKWQVFSYRLPEPAMKAVKLEILSSWELTLPNDPRRFAVQLQSLEENSR
jgi:O-antigen ligase